MPLEKESSGQAVFPVPLEDNSLEAGTDGLKQEARDHNELLWQDIMEILEFEQGLEIDMTSSEFDSTPLEKESPEVENDGLLMLEEIELNDLFPEINQSLDLEEVFQIPCPETMSSEQDPTPAPSSGENQDLNLKENDRETEEFQEVELQKKSAAPKTGSNGMIKRDRRGKCCECNKGYLDIFQHKWRKHKGKLGKCTASLDCKKYFASAQKRAEHEQQEHLKRKKFCCQLCHYSTDVKRNSERHVLRKHLEKKIKCGQQKCGKMFASEADLRYHVKWCHTMQKCRKCSREMSLNAIKEHKRYERCRFLASE